MNSIFHIFLHIHPLLCVFAATPIKMCNVYSQSLDLNFATWHALSMGFEQTCCKQRLQKMCFSTTICECFLVTLLDSERCMNQSQHSGSVCHRSAHRDSYQTHRHDQPLPAGSHSSRPVLVEVSPVCTKRWHDAQNAKDSGPQERLVNLLNVAFFKALLRSSQGGGCLREQCQRTVPWKFKILAVLL